MKARIISASRRTDIPAFYSSWFMNRVRAGYCVYPNPLYPSKNYIVSLRKEELLGIVFWTRHAAPLIPFLNELDSLGYHYYFQYTVVGYPGYLDKKTPELDHSIKTFLKLANHIDHNRVVWRYDPIILTRELNTDWHVKNFRYIADKIAEATDTVVISVVDKYTHNQKKLKDSVGDISYVPANYDEVLNLVADEAMSRGLMVQSCAENLRKHKNIKPGSCIDAFKLYELSGRKDFKQYKYHRQRDNCLCHESTDIGVNDTCCFGCLYCYATKNHEKALQNFKSHRPEWNSITADIKVKLPEKNHEQQMTLF